MASGGAGGSRQLLHAVGPIAVTAAALAGASLGSGHTGDQAAAHRSSVDRAELARLSAALTPRVAQRVERIRGWLLYARLPLQALFALAVWRASRPAKR
jgi:hypothetical protein